MATASPQTQMRPSVQFLVFIALTIGLIVAGGLLAFGIIRMIYGADVLSHVTQMDISTPAEIQALWVLQVVSTSLPLLLIPLVFAQWIVREPHSYLKETFDFPPLLLLFIFFIMLFSSPVIEVLSNLNQHLALPPSLKAIEDWMQAAEKSAEKATNLLLKMNTIGDLLKALLLVGLFTAVAEELMFRGVLQTIFTRWTRNPHTAIWITATLFSAFHMEFYGFLPRLMLGILFGYFVYWSGSIWTSVWAHFINNGTAVVVTYLFQYKKIDLDPANQHVFDYKGYVLSMIITVFLLYTYRATARAGYEERQN